MYTCIYLHIYHKHQPNVYCSRNFLLEIREATVGKYTSPMDPIGIKQTPRINFRSWKDHHNFTSGVCFHKKNRGCSRVQVTEDPFSTYHMQKLR